MDGLEEICHNLSNLSIYLLPVYFKSLIVILDRCFSAI
jgi:hypothetical protein